MFPAGACAIETARFGDGRAVRELQSVIERVVSLDGELPLSLATSDVGTETAAGHEDLPSPILEVSELLAMGFKRGKDRLLRLFEREYLSHVVRKHEGNLTRAGASAGLDRNHLRRLLRKHGINAKDE